MIKIVDIKTNDPSCTQKQTAKEIGSSDSTIESLTNNLRNCNTKNPQPSLESLIFVKAVVTTKKENGEVD